MFFEGQRAGRRSACLPRNPQILVPMQFSSGGFARVQGRTTAKSIRVRSELKNEFASEKDNHRTGDMILLLPKWPGSMAMKIRLKLIITAGKPG